MGVAMIAIEFTVIFLGLVVFGYLLPAGQFYYWFYVRKSPEKESRRIQQRRPDRGQIAREVKLSLLTLAIFAVMGTGLYQLYKAGYTSIYLDLRQYPLIYLPISFFVALFLFDTYFYWMHRFMHWNRVFRYIHLGHHRSVAPTPWAIFAFQPLEAVIQFISIMLLVIFLPMHPIVLVAFLWYDTIVNTAGHTGYEMVPEPVSRNWIFKWFNTVSHHDAHHTNTRVNFGSFFNVWDRWMGTFAEHSPQGAAPQHKESSRSDQNRRRAASRLPVAPPAAAAAKSAKQSAIGKR